MLSGVSAAVQMIMEGVPEPADLRATVHDGWTVVSVGRVAVAGYRSDDGGMRNMVAVTLTGLGFTGRRVAEVLGLTPEYVSELRGQARREGSAGLTRRPGRATARPVSTRECSPPVTRRRCCYTGSPPRSAPIQSSAAPPAWRRI